MRLLCNKYRLAFLLALLALWLSPNTATAATNKLNLQIMNSFAGPLSSCDPSSSQLRFKFRITNYDSVGVDLNTLQVTAWTNDASVQFANYDWTYINVTASQFANHTETTVASCGTSPRIASRKLVQTWGTSAIIPAGGYAQGEIWYWRSGSTPFDVGCDDYSKTNWTDTAWHDDPYFTLSQSGTLVCEYTSSVSTDPNSGVDPCTGLNNCAVPTATPSPTRTPSPTPTPQMSLVKSSPSSVVTLGDTLTFCIHWINDSNGTMTRVIRDVVPPSMTYLGSDTGGIFGGGRVTWSIPGAISGSNGNVCFWGRVTGVP